MKQQVRRCFDRAHATYSLAAVVQKEIAEACARLVPEEQTFATALEIGAGGGLLTRSLLPRVQVGCYLACDLSRAMLAHLPAAHLHRFQADGEQLPLPSGCVDLLVSASTLQWYTAPHRSLPANLDLLRPGGTFVLALFVRGTLPELAASSRATGFGTLQPLLPASTYRHILDATPGLSWQSRVQTHTQWHRSVTGFLRSHKKTGATFSPGRKAFLGKDRLARFCRYYASRFARDNSIPARYRVLYLWGRRGG